MQRTPSKPTAGDHVLFEHFWVKAGPLPLPETDARLGDGKFVLTNSVSMHLRNLARAVLCRYPILLQVIARLDIKISVPPRTGDFCKFLPSRELMLNGMSC